MTKYKENREKKKERVAGERKASECWVRAKTKERGFCAC